jgi:hypothetical protein
MVLLTSRWRRAFERRIAYIDVYIVPMPQRIALAFLEICKRLGTADAISAFPPPPWAMVGRA